MLLFRQERTRLLFLHSGLKTRPLQDDAQKIPKEIHKKPTPMLPFHAFSTWKIMRKNGSHSRNSPPSNRSSGPRPRLRPRCFWSFQKPGEVFHNRRKISEILLRYVSIFSMSSLKIYLYYPVIPTRFAHFSYAQVPVCKLK